MDQTLTTFSIFCKTYSKEQAKEQAGDLPACSLVCFLLIFSLIIRSYDFIILSSACLAEKKSPQKEQKKRTIKTKLN
ncbi:hypothetical protein [Lactobacillus delbrueckii]|uniref:hypothetical protein n=1 Tax=Lactobacillus delbrueckii TaxID=1584 RepID=UPI003993C36F